MIYNEMIITIDGVESEIWQGIENGAMAGYYYATGELVEKMPLVYEMKYKNEEVTPPWMTPDKL